MLDLEQVLELLTPLTTLRFFLSEPAARLELAKLVGRMATTYEQVGWLATRTQALCNDWPGPLVLRQIFCSKYKPGDGIEAGRTELFPEGLPAEHPKAPGLAKLPPGRVASADIDCERAVLQLAEAKSMDRATSTDLEVYTPPPDFAHLEELRRARLRRQHREIMDAMGLKGVTQADIDRAVEEFRAKKACGETA